MITAVFDDGLKYYDFLEGKGPIAGSTVQVHFDCLYRGITVVSSRESKLLDGNRVNAQVGAQPGKERKREFVDNPNGLFSAQAEPKAPSAMYTIVEGMRVGGKGNNGYIFPGFGLGLIMSGTIHVCDEMLLAASETLATQVSQENYDNGLIYPPFTNIRKISANIAASVAAKTYEFSLASHLPRPKDLVKYAESCMYSPGYRSYL